MPVATLSDHATLVAALRRSLRARNGAEVRLIETHISSVLLSGEYAYKLKKPLALGFLDFSTLALRRHCCEEEVRLNRRTAPDIYLDVVTVNGTLENAEIGGSGPLQDVAVRMRRFAADATLDRLLSTGSIAFATVDALADTVAHFHARVAARDGATDYGTARGVQADAADNLGAIAELGPPPALAETLTALTRWTSTEGERLATEFEARRASGQVRECHGDLHLGNIAVLDGRPVLFDCIEFNAALRWTDVMCEMAFLVMDFIEHGRSDAAFRCLNRYLEQTGDYAGVNVLRWYLVYRALVRAKVALIRAREPGLDAAIAATSVARCAAYVRLAASFIVPQRPRLLVTCGVSGSGKTFLSQAVLEALGALRVRSDVERKRLAGLPPLARTDSAPGSGLYGPAATHATYARLNDLAGALLATGFPVIVDATCLRTHERTTFRETAQSAQADFTLLACEAPPATLRARISARSAQADDASEADVAVLERQLAAREALNLDEAREAVVYDGTPGHDVAAVLAALAAHTP